jgi:hypothetical protein
MHDKCAYLNVYGKAMDESKREAHGKVIRLVLPLKVAWCPLEFLLSV